MNRVQAITNIEREGSNQRCTRTSMNRLLASLRALGCTAEEVRALMNRFDYWDTDGVAFLDKHPRTGA